MSCHLIKAPHNHFQEELIQIKVGNQSYTKEGFKLCCEAVVLIKDSISINIGHQSTEQYKLHQQCSMPLSILMTCTYKRFISLLFLESVCMGYDKYLPCHSLNVLLAIQNICCFKKFNSVHIEPFFIR